MPVQTVIKVRRDTAANWTSTNPVLAAGEMGLETDTNLIKNGDGSSAWDSLGYASSSQVTRRVKAAEGMGKGSAVYASGSDGANLLVLRGNYSTEATSSKILGLIDAGVSTNGFANVVTEGILAGLNTSAATAGDPVWLGSNGYLLYGIANKPVAPNHMVYIGVVVRAHATQGAILVKVQNGFELEELHDVLITSEANLDLLSYDSASGLWKNKTIANAGVAAASHTHTLSQITDYVAPTESLSPFLLMGV